MNFTNGKFWKIVTFFGLVSGLCVILLYLKAENGLHIRTAVKSIIMGNPERQTRIAKNDSLLKVNLTQERVKVPNTTLKAVNSESNRLPRILCWVMTSPSDLEKRTRHVQNTWARHCDIDLYMSSVENKSFPTIGLNVTEGRNHIAMKSKASWTYVYERYINKAEYFVKLDPDSFLVVENLKFYLSKFSPDEPRFFGHLFYRGGNKSFEYMSGGPGVVLSRESVKLLVTVGFKKYPNCMPDGQGEDWKSALCLRLAGGIPMNTTDDKGRDQFLVFSPHTHLFGRYPAWYLQYDLNKGRIKGVDCCSEYPIAYHYVSPQDMYLFHYFIYNVKIHSHVVREGAPDVKNYLLQKS
ncbi:unnamed protein product [Owenia fusiformis]|uniref:N-acetylgalactosaminide beta-1,3-galactosyltransferase n=1 Tax=Owenia fusiformis TaxID=6347 RepID=A0A8J1U356_OWEFU|nr:unnamed protein product [Owenia fusiformis]